MPRKLRLLPTLLVLLAANAFAAGRPLAPAPLFPNDEFTQNLSIAHAGGRFLAAWNSGSVWGALLDSNGRRISPSAFLIAETQFADAVEVVGTGDSFAVFWPDRDSRIHLTDVAPDGRILGNRLTELPRGTLVRAAWDGEHFLAVVFGEVFRPNASRALVLGRDGTIVHDIPLAVGVETARVAVTPRGFLAFTGTADSFYAYAITPDGQSTQMRAGDLPQEFALTVTGEDRLLMVTATYDGTIRSQVWEFGAKTVDRIIFTQHNGGVAPVAIMRGAGLNRVILENERTGKLLSMHLDDQGNPVAEPEPVSDTIAGPHPAGASNGEVLVVVHKGQGSVVASLAFDRDSAVGPVETLSIRPASQNEPLLSAGGGLMLAAWTESAPPDIRVRTAVIDRDFETENVRELAPKGLLRAMAWSGTEHLVLYERDHVLYGARVTYDGNPFGDHERIAETRGESAAVAWAGDRWAIAWTEPASGRVLYTTMSRGGSVSRPRTLLTLAGPVVSLSIAYDGNRVHVAWVEGGPFPVPEHLPGIAVGTMRLRRDGRSVDPARLTIPSNQPLRVAIAASSDRVVLVVDEWERSVLHVLSAKTRELVSTQTLLGEYANSAVTWSGYDFYAASAAARSLTVWNLGRDGTSLDDARTTAAFERFWPGVSIAATPSYDAVTGLQELHPADGARAVIYPSREMPRPNP